MFLLFIMVFIIVFVNIMRAVNRFNEAGERTCQGMHKWIYENDNMICSHCRLSPAEVISR
jgi:hypothetical protein